MKAIKMNLSLLNYEDGKWMDKTQQTLEDRVLILFSGINHQPTAEFRSSPLTPCWLSGLRIRWRSSPSVTDRAIFASSSLQPPGSENEEPLPSAASLTSPVTTPSRWMGLSLDLLKAWKIFWLLQVSRLLEEGEVVRLSESLLYMSCSCRAEAREFTGQTVSFFTTPEYREEQESPQATPSVFRFSGQIEKGQWIGFTFVMSEKCNFHQQTNFVEVYQISKSYILTYLL